MIKAIIGMVTLNTESGGKCNVLDLEEYDRFLSELNSTKQTPTWICMNPDVYKRMKKAARRQLSLWRGYKSRGRKNIVHRYGGR